MVFRIGCVMTADTKEGLWCRSMKADTKMGHFLYLTNCIDSPANTKDRLSVVTINIFCSNVTSVNFKYLFNTSEKITYEPFILASQASQVYYVVDPIETKWVAVVQPKPHDLYRSDDGENELLDNSNEVDVLI
jgi:hypothetical protein